MQMYLDYATPAIAAGAVKRKGFWSIQGDKTEYGFISSLCAANGIEPVEMAVPKTRTFKALQKAARKACESTSGGKDHHAMRAVQYMLKMRGVETTYQPNPFNSSKRVRWGKAADGSNRARFVEIEDEWHEVPHWDFVARVEDLSNTTVDLGAELLESL